MWPQFMLFLGIHHIHLATSLTTIDHQLATWFHARLNANTGPVLQAMSFAASGTLMIATLISGVLWLALKRRWQALITFILTVPCGVLLGEGLKLIVRRQRPYLAGPFVDWAGYSFPSGHAISATLFYGLLCIWAWSALKSKHWRALALCLGALITLAVGFSRIALGAHYFMDVLAGFGLGIIWLATCITGRRVLKRQLRIIRSCTTAERATAELGATDLAAIVA